MGGWQDRWWKWQWMELKVAEVTVGVTVLHQAAPSLFCSGVGRCQCPLAHPQCDAVTRPNGSFPLWPTSGSHAGSGRHRTHTQALSLALRMPAVPGAWPRSSFWESCLGGTGPRERFLDPGRREKERERLGGDPTRPPAATPSRGLQRSRPCPHYLARGPSLLPAASGVNAGGGRGKAGGEAGPRRPTEGTCRPGEEPNRPGAPLGRRRPREARRRL